MFGDILSALSLGRKLVETVSDLRRDIHTVRGSEPRTEVQSGLEALESRFGNLETQVREQHARAVNLEQSLNDVLSATEALAARVSTIFWLAAIGCGLAVASVILAAVAL